MATRNESPPPPALNAPHHVPPDCTVVPAASADVILSTGASNTCPDGYGKITVESECIVAMTALGIASGEYQGGETESSWPAGCYFCDGVNGCIDGVWFNTHGTGSGASGGANICASVGPPTVPPPPTTAPPPGVLFVGDSDIERWTTAGVFPGSANVGVGGWTCNNVANQIDGFLATHTPTEVVLVCGENDLGNGASVATTFSRFSQVVASITNTGARVVYMGTKPEPDTTSFHDEYREYDALIRGLAIDLSAAAGSSAGPPPLAMVDVYPSFTALGNPSSLYANDGLHLSNAGYSYWNSWAATALAAAAGPCTLWESGVCTPTNPPTNPLPPTTPPTNPPPTNEPPCTVCDLGATNAACSSGGQCCSGQCKRRRCKRGFVETCFPPTPPPPTPAPAAGPPPTTAPPLCGNPGDFCTSNSMCCGNCNNRKQKCR